jgi:glutathione S-transferase
VAGARIDGRPGVITLWQFPPALGLANASPFCMKVETWLRLAGLEYRVRHALLPMRAPLGKLPYVEDGGRRIPDSSRIVAELSRAHGIDLDARLDARGRVVAHACARMVEEHLYWALVYSRWIDPRYWPAMRQASFGSLPPGPRGAVAAFARRKITRDARGHGLALHEVDEIYRRGAEDITALAGLLGGQPYVMGSEASNLDATVYAFLANCWEVPIDSPLKTAVGAHPNLVAYCARLKLRCFG